MWVWPVREPQKTNLIQSSLIKLSDGVIIGAKETVRKAERKTGTWKRKKERKKAGIAAVCLTLIQADRLMQPVAVYTHTRAHTAHALPHTHIQPHTQEVWAAGPVTKTGWLPWQTESAGNSPKEMTKNGMGERRRCKGGGRKEEEEDKKEEEVDETLVCRWWKTNEQLSLLPLLKLLLRCLWTWHSTPSSSLLRLCNWLMNGADLLVHWLYIYSFKVKLNCC